MNQATTASRPTKPVRPHHPFVEPEQRKPRAVPLKIEPVKYPPEIAFFYINREAEKGHNDLRGLYPIYTIAFKIDGDNLIYGMARKSPLDNFSRIEGRRLAFGELMHRLNKTGAENPELGGSVTLEQIQKFLAFNIIMGTDGMVLHRFNEASGVPTSAITKAIEEAASKLTLADCKTSILRDLIITVDPAFKRKGEVFLIEDEA